MYMFGRVEDFIVGLGGALCQLGLVELSSTGCELAKQVLPPDLAEHAPEARVRVDFEVLRSNLVRLFEKLEADVGNLSYPEAARAAIYKTRRACVAAHIRVPRQP